MTTAAPHLADSQHPWIGLASFTEGDREFFAGRGEEIDELLRLVRRDILTLLYGVSGLGKTSLLQAGLFPALRAEDCLPVPIRLDYHEGASPLCTQVLGAIITAADAAQVEAPKPSPDETLWEYLHRDGNHFWSSHNDLVTPFLAFDQFEEFFTLGRETSECTTRATAFVSELADLVENRPPAALRDDPMRAKEFNFKPVPLKVLLAMREDYLADLDRIRTHFRALGQNRLRLQPMGERQARQVIDLGAPLLAPGVEDRILKFVAAGDDDAETIIAPALLSLVLRELNERRLARERDAKITPDLLDVEQQKIFEDFYLRTIQDFPVGVRTFIEDKLLTTTGYRDSCALDDALSCPDVTQAILNELVNRRLLAYEDRHRTRRVELTHDVLIPVIKASRDTRLMREALTRAELRERLAQKEKERQERELEVARELAEEQKRRAELSEEREKEQKEAARKLRLRAIAAMGAAAAALLLLLTSVFMWRAAQEQAQIANTQRLVAQSASAEAEDQAHIATVQRFANDFWTPSSADRNILFACQLVRQLSGRTENDSLRCGEAASILNLALDRRKRLIETHWNFKLPDADSKEVSRVPVYAVAYSSDGQTLIAGGRDSKARVRILRDGVLGDPITVSGTDIRAIAFSPDDSKVAIGTKAGSVSILDLNPSDPAHAVTHLELPVGVDETTIVWSCSWNLEGDLAAAAQDGTVYIWSDLLHSLRSGIVPPPLQLKNGAPVFTVAWDHGGSLLAIGDTEGNVRFWNKMALSEPTKAHRSAIWGLAWSQDGRLACASWDCSISVWKADNLRPMQPPTCLKVKLQAHSYWVRDVVWIDEDRTIASAGDDGTIRFWRSSDLDELGSEPTPTQAVWKLSYSSILKTFAAACNDSAIRIYKFNTPKTDTHGFHRNTIICLAFGRSSVLSFDQEGGVEDFDPTSRVDNSFQIPTKFKSGIQSVCFYPQREAFVIGYAQPFQGDKHHGGLAVWSPHADEVKSCSTEESVGYIACHPTQSIVAFATKSGAIGFKSLPELQAVSGLQDLQPIPKASEKSVECILSWSPAGDKLLIATVPDVGDSQIRIFRFDDKGLTVVAAFPVPVRLSCVQWAPSELLVALGTKAGAIIVQPIGGSKSSPISAHDKSVETLNWSADGHHLFTGCEDGTIKLWDYTANGNKLSLVVTLRHPSGAVYAAGLSRDGEVLYTAGNSSTIFHWLVGNYTLDSILARAQKMIHRNMFKSEWDRYASDSVPKNPYVKTFDALPALYLLKSP